MMLWRVLLWCLIGAGSAHAAYWDGILATDRAITWNGIGANITAHATRCGSQIAAYTGTAATINTAITNCTPGEYVELGAGTFSLTTGITLKTGVVVRGQGADQTKLIFTANGASGCPLAAFIAICGGGGTYPPNPDNLVNWTAGYSKGTTVLTLSAVTNLAIGSLLVLDQLDEAPGTMAGAAADNGNVWNCWSDITTGSEVPVCSSETVTTYRTHRNTSQTVTVTAINGNDVTITPGLYMPTWRSGQSPQAFYSSTAPISNCGLEHLSMDVGAVADSVHIIKISNATDCWIKGIRLLSNSSTAWRCGFCVLAARQITIRDSYIYGSASASQSYGQSLEFASDLLFENNIWEAQAVPMVGGQAAQGIVHGYNYAINDFYYYGTGTHPTDCGVTLGCDWMQASSYAHAIGNNYYLWEGNDGIGYTADAIHGPSFFQTMFRNRWRGYDPDGGSMAGKTVQTIAVHIYAYNRYYNLIGNILGESGLHTAYEGYPTSASEVGPTANTINVAIYQLGWSSNQTKNTVLPVAPGIDNDVRVRQTLMRWGNWDTVNAATQWTSGEVPTGDAYYPNTVPASQTLPSSFYLSAQPSWWATAYGTPAWPPIGPDVTCSVNCVSDVGSHVAKIPARLCYENMADDAEYAGTTVRVFNAAACYGVSGAGAGIRGSKGLGLF